MLAWRWRNMIKSWWWYWIWRCVQNGILLFLQRAVYSSYTYMIIKHKGGGMCVCGVECVCVCVCVWCGGVCGVECVCVCVVWSVCGVCVWCVGGRGVCVVCVCVCGVCVWSVCVCVCVWSVCEREWLVEQVVQADGGFMVCFFIYYCFSVHIHQHNDFIRSTEDWLKHNITVQYCRYDNTVIIFHGFQLLMSFNNAAVLSETIKRDELVCICVFLCFGHYIKLHQCFLCKNQRL